MSHENDLTKEKKKPTGWFSRVTKAQTHLPNSFTLIADMPATETWEKIKALYRSPSVLMKALASVLNAMFTSGSVAILFSYGILKQMLKSDPNLELGELEVSQQAAIMKGLLVKQDEQGDSFGFFEEVRKSSRYSQDGGDRKAAIYVLSEPDLRAEIEAVIGTEAAQEQIDTLIRSYDHPGSKSPNSKEGQDNNGTHQ